MNRKDAGLSRTRTDVWRHGNAGCVSGAQKPESANRDWSLTPKDSAGALVERSRQSAIDGNAEWANSSQSGWL